MSEAGRLWLELGFWIREWATLCITIEVWLLELLELLLRLEASRLRRILELSEALGLKSSWLWLHLRVLLELLLLHPLSCKLVESLTVRGLSLRNSGELWLEWLKTKLILLRILRCRCWASWRRQ